MEKAKKIIKYVLNGLAIINALIIGIAPIWEINADKVTNTIAVIIAVLSTYLLGNKVISNKSSNELETQSEPVEDHEEEVNLEE